MTDNRVSEGLSEVEIEQVRRDAQSGGFTHVPSRERWLATIDNQRRDLGAMTGERDVATQNGLYLCDLLESKQDELIDLEAKVGHVHSRACYDDAGGGHGSPTVICGQTTKDELIESLELSRTLFIRNEGRLQAEITRLRQKNADLYESSLQRDEEIELVRKHLATAQDEAQGEWKRANDNWNAGRNMKLELEGKLEAAEARCSTLETALRVYATKSNWPMLDGYNDHWVGPGQNGYDLASETLATAGSATGGTPTD